MTILSSFIRTIYPAYHINERGILLKNNYTQNLAYHFSTDNHPIFISVKLDLKILIFYKLVPCVTFQFSNILIFP